MPRFSRVANFNAIYDLPLALHFADKIRERMQSSSRLRVSNQNENSPFFISSHFSVLIMPRKYSGIIFLASAAKPDLRIYVWSHLWKIQFCSTKRRVSTSEYLFLMVILFCVNRFEPFAKLPVILDSAFRFYGKKIGLELANLINNKIY